MLFRSGVDLGRFERSVMLAVDGKLTGTIAVEDPVKATTPRALADLRASVGVGVSWISPVGPLKLSYGKPIRSFDQDKIQKLQFQIGTVF